MGGICKGKGIRICKIKNTTMNKNKVAKRIVREMRRHRPKNYFVSHFLINIKSNAPFSLDEKSKILQHWVYYKRRRTHNEMLEFLIDEYGKEWCKECRISRDYVGRKTHKVGDRFYSEMPSENDHLPF